MTLKLPELAYSYDALSPYMSRETLEFHHDKHHNAYVTNGNNLLKGTDLENKPLEEIIKISWEKKLSGIFNNAAQHWNHIEFWKMMSPKSGKIPGNLEKELINSFGSIEKFKEDFCTNGVAQFGSGWVWLVKDGEKLKITKTPNGENPIVDGGKTLLGCDVWEHSYYIDYRNARPNYLKSFLDNLVNWEYVTEKLEEK